jgi:hypothetical protein
MVPVYGGACLQRKLDRGIFQGRWKVADDARPGRNVEIVTKPTVQGMEELIKAERRIIIDSVATALGCSHGLAYSIMYDHLNFRSVLVRWMPRKVKDREEMKNRMGLSLQHLLRYADGGEDMLNGIATWDESWVHH